MRNAKSQMTLPQLKRSMDRRFKDVTRTMDRRFEDVDRRFAEVNKRFELLERLVVAEAEKTRRHFDIVAEASDEKSKGALDLLRHHAVVLVEHEGRIADLESHR